MTLMSDRSANKVVISDHIYLMLKLKKKIHGNKISAIKKIVSGSVINK